MLDIRYAEYDAIHRGNFIFDVPNGHDSWLLILTHTPAVFGVDEAYVEYPPNCVVLYRPKQRIYYRACEERYSNDWIRFDTDEVYIESTPIICGVPLVVHDPGYFHKLFQLITAEHEKDSEMKYIIADKLLQIFFYKLSEINTNKPAMPLCKNLQDLRNEIHQRPDENWTVKGMAEKLNISTGHLENIYKEAFGVSCLEDVIISRVNLVKKYLLNSHHTLSEIMTLCGYRNAEHFFRQFKRLTGVTPNKFRKDLAARDNNTTKPCM